MPISPSSRSRHPAGTRDLLDYVARRSETAAMLRRSLCCVLALSTPYAMFLLNGVLRP